VDWSTVISSMVAGDKLYFQRKTDASTYNRYTLTGAPTLFGTTTWILPVTWTSGTGEPANGTDIVVAFQRMTDFPSHHATHETGGSDAITALSGSVITSGTVPDARLSSNVPLLNAANVFSANQAITKTDPNLALVDSSQAADARVFRLASTAGVLVIQATNDAQTVNQGAALLGRTGVLTVAAGLGLTPLNATQLSSGAVPDARLSSNVPLKTLSNVFTTAPQQITAASAELRLVDPTQPVDARTFRLINSTALFFQATNDAVTVQSGLVTMTRAGGIAATGSFAERGRGVALGDWTDLAFSASNFAALGGGTWTVNAAAVLRNRYTLIGRTLIWNIYVAWTAGSSVVAGTVTGLVIAGPFPFIGPMGMPLAQGFDGGVVAPMWCSNFSTGIQVVKSSGTNYTAGTVGFIGMVTGEI
jgi:hypothetical protein